MFYPIRRLRRRQNRKYAFQHLYKKLICLQRNCRPTHQSSKKDMKHVSFSGEVTVCPFKTSVTIRLRNNHKEPPIFSFIHYPSHIDELSKEAIIALANEMNLPYNGVKIDDMKKRITDKWINRMRDYLSEHQIDVSSIPDAEIENCYSLYLSFKRSANVYMSGESLVPLTMNIHDLHEYMKNHGLSIQSNPTRDMCVRSVETYLLDHVKPFDSPVGDLSRKRLSSVDYFNNTFYYYSKSMLNSILRKYQIKEEKNTRTRKQAVIDLIERELSQLYRNALREVFMLFLKYHEIPFDETQSLSSLFLLCYEEKRKCNVFLEETDLLSVCWE